MGFSIGGLIDSVGKVASIVTGNPTFGLVSNVVGGQFGTVSGGSVGPPLASTSAAGKIAISRGLISPGSPASQIPRTLTAAASAGGLGAFEPGGRFARLGTIRGGAGVGTVTGGAGRDLILAGGSMAAGGIMSLFNGGPKTVGTILALARENSGRAVTSKKIRDAARFCGLDVAASMFGLDVEDVCFVVVSSGRRRSRGISASDLRRTRSTIRKINTMQRSLAGLAKGAGRDARGRFK